MICKKCETGVYMQAFSTIRCKLCGKEIVTCHTPGHALCDECSDKYGACAQCGKSQWEQVTFDEIGVM